MRTAAKWILVVVAGAIVVSVAGFAWLRFAPRSVPAGQLPLRTLRSGDLETFRNEFNSAHGEVRVLAMLSPT